MKIVLYIIILLVIAFAAAPYLRPPAELDPRHVEGLPWQIETLPEGYSRVFGLTLSRDTLADARQRLGEDKELAIIVGRDEHGSLEMYYSHYTAGVLKGKLVLVGDIEQSTLRDMRERSGVPKYMESGARKFHLDSADLERAYLSPIQSITFIPTANLDREVAERRFGAPVEIIEVNRETVHFLYPHLGLDLMINEEHKEVMQYVAPKEFERLREPLLESMEETGQQ